MKRIPVLLVLTAFVGLAAAFPWSPSTSARPARQMEHLGRGFVAIHPEQGKVFVSWRLFGTDPDGIAFNVYRRSGDGEPVKLNDRPAHEGHLFHGPDRRPVEANRLFRPPGPRRQGTGAERPFKLPANPPVRPYLSIPLKTLPGHTPNDASVGDLDGDGEYEIVLKQEQRPRDNSQTRHDRRDQARSLQARRHVPLADQPGQEHPRGGPLHAVPRLRPRRRRQGRGRLQDGRRHRRRHGQGHRRPDGRPPQRRTATSSTVRSS